MYIIFPIFLFFLILCSWIFYCYKRHIIHKVCSMSRSEKSSLLNELIQPLGFGYLLSSDLFISCFHAWQRDYGYCHLYDHKSIHFNMIFDCEPIYFDYEGCTWLIEVWKGQNVINVGAEIGIYKADTLIPDQQKKHSLFHTVPDKYLPVFSLSLYKEGCPVFSLSQKHWWMAGFRMGTYTSPKLLTLKVSITFPSLEMQHAFLRGLQNIGYDSKMICICGLQVSFDFTNPYSKQPQTSSFYKSFTQWKNRIFLSLYCRASKPFHTTMDKLLYLYFFLPFTFRYLLCIHRKYSGKRMSL